MGRVGQAAWNKGKKMSEESRRKLSESLMGRPQTNPNSLKNLIRIPFPKGHTPWNKGKSVSLSPQTEFKKGMIPWNKGKKLSREHCETLSKSHIGIPNANKGKKRPELSKENHPNWKGGAKKRLPSSEANREVWRRPGYREKMSGENSSAWKGGRTPKNKKLRRSVEFNVWRDLVFARDNWTCQKYKVRGGKLHPHHIQNFAEYPELRFEVSNGITLSEKAHKEFHKIYGLRNNTLDQILEFIAE